MRKFGTENYPGFNPSDVGHDFTGPYGNNRKITSTSWIEFSNTDLAKDFLKKIENKDLKVEGVEIKTKVARTQFQKKRNYAMRKIEEFQRASSKNEIKNVTIVWKVEGSKKRHIVVVESVPFLQDEHDAIGVFSTPFTDLSID